MTVTLESLLNDRVILPQTIESLSSIYKVAKPFRHLVIDGMFPSALLDRVVTEVPPMSEDHQTTEGDGEPGGYGPWSATELGEAGFELTALLHSAGFLYLLSELTGIWQLLPDPYLHGSGYHRVLPGADLSVNLDRPDYETGLTRRLSLVIFLNEDWKPEHGGEFELWNSDGTRRELAVEPVFNRTVILETADAKYHGVPQTAVCPKGRSHNSFTAYYYTAVISGRSEVPPHTSDYAPSFYRRKKSLLREILKDVTPPIIARVLKGTRAG